MNARTKNLTTILILFLTSLFATAVAQDVSIPDPGLNAAIRDALHKTVGSITQEDMLSLTNVDAGNRNINSLTGLETARNLIALTLFNNHLTNFVLPSEFRKLAVLDIGFNALAQCTLAPRLTNLDTLFLEGNALTNFSLPAGLTGLTRIDLSGNALTRFSFPVEMTNLAVVLIFANQLTNVILPPDLSRLVNLDLAFNRLRSLTLSAGAGGLNRLTLRGNQLSNLTLPSGMTNLTFLDLAVNQLSEITLPPDVINLTSVFLAGNPITRLVLSEPVATTSLASLVTSLQDGAIPVFTYPTDVQLIRVRQPIGAFQFAVTGPPGAYAVLASSDLANWSQFAMVSNTVGAVVFTDGEAHLSSRKFYRAVLQTPPTDLVFVPANTFAMGSPANEQDRDPNEGPQTLVTLSRGFWIGKYEVTQGEYLSIMNTNPSAFPADLSGPVSSVSWPDATNYCAKLTQRERIAGRISASREYRLPTEAEWECAARAGTSTRFSYGDDPGYADLPNYAWQSVDDGLMVHPVGQKLPNPWGLYDMAGNVFEWCQDWLGPLPGGSVTDPQGPPSNLIGWKIMRGGSFDFGGAACRSASRNFFGNHPALTDWNLGFRVVLVTEP